MRIKMIIWSVAIALTFLNLSAFAQKRIDFSGTWVLNTHKSTFGEVPNFVAIQKLDVTQAVDSIKLVGLSIDKDGNEIKGGSAYSLDGKVTARLIKAGEKLAGSFMSSADGTQLLKSQAYIADNSPGEPVRSVGEVWSLSADGKHLTIVQTVKSKAGNYSYTAVYDKQ